MGSHARCAARSDDRPRRVIASAEPFFSPPLDPKRTRRQDRVCSLLEYRASSGHDIWASILFHDAVGEDIGPQTIPVRRSTFCSTAADASSDFLIKAIPA